MLPVWFIKHRSIRLRDPVGGRGGEQTSKQTNKQNNNKYTPPSPKRTYFVSLSKINRKDEVHGVAE